MVFVCQPNGMRKILNPWRLELLLHTLFFPFFFFFFFPFWAFSYFHGKETFLGSSKKKGNISWDILHASWDVRMKPIIVMNKTRLDLCWLTTSKRRILDREIMSWKGNREARFHFLGIFIDLIFFELFYVWLAFWFNQKVIHIEIQWERKLIFKK